jgi:hypothetical protein
MELYNENVPTSNPNMPDAVHLMKKIYFKIKEKFDTTINVYVNDAKLGIELADHTTADTAARCRFCACPPL